MQDEDDPLGRAEPLQHDQQGEPDPIVEGDPVGGIGQRGLGRRRDELDLAGVVNVFPAKPGGLDLVQAQAAGHHDKPAALVLDFAEVRADQAGERVLHDVLSRAYVADHPKCQVNKVWEVVLVRLADLPGIPFPVHAALPFGPPGIGYL